MVQAQNKYLDSKKFYKGIEQAGSIKGKVSYRIDDSYKSFAAQSGQTDALIKSYPNSQLDPKSKILLSR
jgi:hypothetical protein